MIVGVGVDAVPVARMRRALDRTPRLSQRVFTRGELDASRTGGRAEESLAARFAAKEACRKAVGVAFPWRDIEVVSRRDRAPTLRIAGRDDLRLHVSLTHTRELAIAVVLAETR